MAFNSSPLTISSSPLKKGARCTVIGSSGCLGREIVAELLRRGYCVQGFDLRPPTLEDERVRYFTGSITEEKDLLPALRNVDAVFHAASPHYFTEDKSLFHKVNVDGTKNVIRCCIECNVTRLVGTSSGIVVFQGADICGKTEAELPIATPFPTLYDAYQSSKILMEKTLLAANGTQLDDRTGTLWTAAIRPQGMFGPEDNTFIPRLEESKNRTVYLSGASTLMDYSYTTNIAHGHILAAEKLHDGSPVCGEVFFVSNDDPQNVRAFTDKLLTVLGYKPGFGLHWTVVMMLLVISHILLAVQLVCQAIGIRYAAPFTPMQIMLGYRSQWHSIDKARRMLGYKPLVSMEEGMRRTGEYYAAKRRGSRKEE